MKVKRILAIAGSDSGGGAGIQADIKTITALGGYAMTAITALTAQNTKGVAGIHAAPPDFLARQIEVVLEDIGADGIKIGMLADVPIIETVAKALTPLQGKIPIVLDPVMVSATGDRLLAENALDALRDKLLPLATLITPNEAEAGLLAGMEIASLEQQEQAAVKLAAMGMAALVTGGEGQGETLVDVLAIEGHIQHFSASRIETRHTHGTGCTLSSALALFLAEGMALEAAVERARAYVRAAIEAAPGFGAGCGPLGHGAAGKGF